MVQFRVTLPVRSYPPAAERTDTPLYEVDEKRSLVKQSTDDYSCFHSKQLLKTVSILSKKNNNI